MFTSYEERCRQRLFLGNLGSGITLLGGILFAVGMIAAFLGIDDDIINITNLVVFALCTICFGIFFTLIFGRIGWHDNKILDFLLNKISVLFTVAGIAIVILANAFQVSDGILIIGLGTSILGFFMGLLGIHFHRTPT